MKLAVIAATLLVATTGTAALANGNSEAAKAMVAAKSTVGANIAPSVSGKNATENGSGWGNNGGVSKSGRNK